MNKKLWMCLALSLTMLARAEEKEAEASEAAAIAAEKAPAPQAAKDDKGTFKLTPYGRVELDIIYSSRGTNSLDPRQFNGYSTAAGPEPRSSSTFNPRFSVFGLASHRTSLLTGRITKILDAHRNYRFDTVRRFP